MDRRRRVGGLVAAVVVAALAVGGVLAVVGDGSDGGRGSRRPEGSSSTSASSSTESTPANVVGAGFDAAVDVELASRPRGGSVRVGVWASPDLVSPGVGGVAVRSLVFPQLFVARPDGRWSPSLVAPGSDRTAGDLRSATFSLRPGAAWSDGSPLGLADLQRTMDPRFVSGVEPGAGAGQIVVRFTQPLPGWRRLWSGNDVIGAPAPGVWGGPFVVAASVPGLETVLVRNPRWVGSGVEGGAFVDEVRLVLVPDSTTARLLLARGELDVVMPPAATVRRAQLERVPGVAVDAVERGGWSVSLVANADRLPLDARRALFASVDRAAFVGTLLKAEATVLDGFAGPEDATWRGVGGGGGGGGSDVGGLQGSTVDLVAFAEEPMSALLHRSMQKRARAAGGTIELRSAEADRVAWWLGAGTFEAALVVSLDPLAMCWRCRFGGAGGVGDEDGVVAAADAGDGSAVATLQSRLRDEARVLPLWRSTTVVAWRSGAVSGVRANGYGPSAAWNAWEWWVPAG